MRMMIPAVVFALLSSSAIAHDWYETACCNDRDCAPAEAGDVTVKPEGYAIGSLGITVPFDSDKIREMRAPDGQFHICATPTTKRFLCLYVPDAGV